MKTKDFLLNILNIEKSINEKNENSLYELLDQLNDENLTIEQVSHIEDYIKTITEVNNKYASILIENIDAIENKEYLLIITELRSQDKLSKERVTEILNKDLEFKYESDKYNLYSLITQLVIKMGDPELIKKAIDKIQSI